LHILRDCRDELQKGIAATEMYAYASDRANPGIEVQKRPQFCLTPEGKQQSKFNI
jgi:hypothetical protein